MDQKELWKAETYYSPFEICVNQLGYFPNRNKTCIFGEEVERFCVKRESGEEVFSSKTKHFGMDSLSGEDVYIGDFSDVTEEGNYYVEANGKKSATFSISKDLYNTMEKDLLKTFYYLRCRDGLDAKFAGKYAHGKCHIAKAKLYEDPTVLMDVCGGWHDAGDYGRYMTAGACAVAHLLYAVLLYPGLLKVSFDIPNNTKLPDILAEAKVELDFLRKLQASDGGAYHKVTTWVHADFVMPEEDDGELFVFPVSSIATADFAAMEALAYLVYKEYDKDYAKASLDAALKAYEWLDENPENVPFKNPKGSNTGEYSEDEDISNRFWAAAALYEATGESKYRSDMLFQKERLSLYEVENKDSGKEGISGGSIFTNFGYAGIAGLGSLAYLIGKHDDELSKELENLFLGEAKRLLEVASKNGYPVPMEKRDFIWGSNMVLGKYAMDLAVADWILNADTYKEAVYDVFDYMLGINPNKISYISGEGEAAFRNPHLRPTAMDDVELPWPGLVSGGPNIGLQDPIADALVAHDAAPMKCYLDHVGCYSLNEITIYWNSPFVFALAALQEGRR